MVLRSPRERHRRVRLGLGKGPEELTVVFAADGVTNRPPRKWKRAETEPDVRSRVPGLDRGPEFGCWSRRLSALFDNLDRHKGPNASADAAADVVIVEARLAVELEIVGRSLGLDKGCWAHEGRTGAATAIRWNCEAKAATVSVRRASDASIMLDRSSWPFASADFSIDTTVR